MTSRITHKIRAWLGKADPQPGAPARTESSARAEFGLFYGELLIGTLCLSDGVWQWSYSDEFRAQDKVVPLIEFPDVNRVYRTEELWPFFSTRAPSLKRTDILPIIAAEQIDPTDEAALLKRFGRRTITNPFVLVAS